MNEMKQTIEGSILACCVSDRVGRRKQPCDVIELRVGVGIVGDAHAGNGHRQVSLLANESVDRMRTYGIDLSAGDFAENILTQGLTVRDLPVGTMLKLGTAYLAVTQIGKTCHNDCEIRTRVGTCVMPTDGIFAVVIKDGTVRPGDKICVIDQEELA